MVYSVGNRILIENVYKCKNYGAINFKNFLAKVWRFLAWIIC